MVEKQRLEENLRSQRQAFENKILIMMSDIHNFESFTEYSKYKNYVTEIEEFEKGLFM